jgi:hypothetical protein
MQPRLHPLRKSRLHARIKLRRHRLDRRRARILLRKHGGATIKFPLQPYQVMKGLFTARRKRKNGSLLTLAA